MQNQVQLQQLTSLSPFNTHIITHNKFSVYNQKKFDCPPKDRI